MTLSTTIVLLFLYQVYTRLYRRCQWLTFDISSLQTEVCCAQAFFTSAIATQIGNRSGWMYFGAEFERVTFLDGQMRLAAVCNDRHQAQSKKNARMQSTPSRR